MTGSPTLIPFDCADEEIGLVVRHALHSLRCMADEILDQANERMNACQNRLTSYNNRLRAVERKFDIMQKSEEVPLITSPAEFPGKVHLSRPLAFHHLNTTITQHTQQHPTKHNQSCKPLSIKELVLRKNGYRVIFPKGKYNELLVAKKCKTLDKGKKKGFIRPEDFYNIKLTSNNNVLFSSNADFATNSLLIYESMKVIDSSDPFTYQPGMSNLNEFDLPDVLPQLTGVTKHAKKQSMFGESDDEESDIFGEVTKRQLDVDLSARSSFYMLDESISRRSTISNSSNIPKTPIKQLDTSISQSTPITSIPVPVIVPPVEDFKSSQQSQVPSTSQPIAAPRSAPVPPPLPPINLLASIPSPPMPGRSDLMEAIRMAGGVGKAALKKAETSNESIERVIVKSKPAESSDDLMGSLAKALERRRKGISGKTAKKFEALETPHKSTGNSTLSSLRELIPPPTKTTNDSDSESGNEEDWK